MPCSASRAYTPLRAERGVLNALREVSPPPVPCRQNRWYIHNATNATLNYGATNVLAIRVDAQTFQEGWFYEGERV